MTGPKPSFVAATPDTPGVSSDAGVSPDTIGPDNHDRPGLSYRSAGVDIDAGDALIDRIKPLAARTHRPGVLAGIGGFGALFSLPGGMREPVLVSSTDGVGTKLKLAFALDRHDSVGIDLVAMSVNDILVQGAEPLYFLDYFACSRLDVTAAAAVVAGIAEGCEQAGCALIGGETAEMPGMYADNEYDLAGFAVGVVERDRIIDGTRIAAGDRLLGLASSGPHSNGYSLIRRVLERVQQRQSTVTSGAPPAAGAQRLLAEPLAGRPLGDWLMAPTRIYVRSLLPLFGDQARPIKGLAHITGGGLIENVPRILPPGCQAVIERSAWQRPEIFAWLQREGEIADDEMMRVFNCGIGMVVVVGAQAADSVRAALVAAGEVVYPIGEVRHRGESDAPIQVV